MKTFIKAEIFRLGGLASPDRLLSWHFVPEQIEVAGFRSAQRCLGACRVG
jgi:hypothetical protein